MLLEDDEPHSMLLQQNELEYSDPDFRWQIGKTMRNRLKVAFEANMSSVSTRDSARNYLTSTNVRASCLSFRSIECRDGLVVTLPIDHVKNSSCILREHGVKSHAATSEGSHVSCSQETENEEKDPYQKVDEAACYRIFSIPIMLQKLIGQYHRVQR